jgi:hypothetical protein
MALIEFYGGEGTNINNLSGSGIGFYGDSGFGYSVPVGSFNGRSFITDSTGTQQGPEVDNCKYVSSGTVILGQTGSGINLKQIPNYLSTLNIRFTHGSNALTQNAKVYGYDRSNKNNSPSGVVLYAAQVIHPSTVQTLTGSGSATWTSLLGSTATLSLSSGPGTSGLSPNGASTSDTRHDWYLALSAGPTTVGAKEFAAWFEMEYL